MRLPKEKPRGKIIDRTTDSDLQKFGRRVGEAWNATLSDFGFRDRKVEGIKDPWKQRKIK